VNLYAVDWPVAASRLRLLVWDPVAVVVVVAAAAGIDIVVARDAI
jgi:hypothetical protein